VALERGEIDENSYDNSLKMERKKSHFESSIYERQKKDKDFGRMLKNYKRGMSKYDY
jgi:ribosome biogenesis GTPase